MTRPQAVLDTDTYNEVDDQFALAHLLLSPEQVDLQAVYAAPFHNDRSTGPGDGMEKSYEEIQRVLERVSVQDAPPVFRGSREFLPGAEKPTESEAVADLVERALEMKAGEKLHVLAIAAATNVAAALLIEPAIAEKIVVVWLGGHAPFWRDTREFNLRQDPHAARVLLDSPAPLVLLPCYPVASHLITCPAELEAKLEGSGKLGAFLTDRVREYCRQHAHTTHSHLSKVIWDIAASAWMVNRDFVYTEKGLSPVLLDDVTWQQPTPAGRKEIDIAVQIERDPIFDDFFAKVARA